MCASSLHLSPRVGPLAAGWLLLSDKMPKFPRQRKKSPRSSDGTRISQISDVRQRTSFLVSLLMSRLSNHWAFSTFAFLLMFMASGCGPLTQGSGLAKTEIRTVDAFQSVSVSGSSDVDITVGPEQSVEITIDDNLLPLITSEVKNGQLKIGNEGRWSSRLGLKVKITVPELTSFAGSGSVDGRISGISSESFEGSISGSGLIIADGLVQQAKASIAGSGEIDFSKLSSQKSSADISGSGTIDIHAKETATASIAGSGTINVHGNPDKIAESIAGSGEVQRK